MTTNGWTHFGLLVKLNAAESIGKVFREAIDGEAPIEEYQMMLLGDMMPIWLSIQWIARLLLGDRMAHWLQASRKHLRFKKVSLPNFSLSHLHCLLFWQYNERITLHSRSSLASHGRVA
jgi:hypothetical protein